MIAKDDTMPGVIDMRKMPVMLWFESIISELQAAFGRVSNDALIKFYLSVDVTDEEHEDGNAMMFIKGFDVAA
jgi:hypothetical protein